MLCHHKIALYLIKFTQMHHIPIKNLESPQLMYQLFCISVKNWFYKNIRTAESFPVYIEEMYPINTYELVNLNKIYL